MVQSAFWKMVVHLWNLCLNSATIITCTLQTLINSFLLLAFFTDNKLRSNSNLFLLISLTFTDLLYSVTELPYVIYMLCGWAAEGESYRWYMIFINSISIFWPQFINDFQKFSLYEKLEIEIYLFIDFFGFWWKLIVSRN